MAMQVAQHGTRTCSKVSRNETVPRARGADYVSDDGNPAPGPSAPWAGYNDAPDMDSPPGVYDLPPRTPVGAGIEWYYDRRGRRYQSPQY